VTAAQALHWFADDASFAEFARILRPGLVTAAEIEAGRYTFRATGSVMKFAGFLSVYDDAPAPKMKLFHRAPLATMSRARCGSGFSTNSATQELPSMRCRPGTI